MDVSGEFGTDVTGAGEYRNFSLQGYAACRSWFTCSPWPSALSIFESLCIALTLTNIGMNFPVIWTWFRTHQTVSLQVPFKAAFLDKHWESVIIPDNSRCKTSTTQSWRNSRLLWQKIISLFRSGEKVTMHCIQHLLIHAKSFVLQKELFKGKRG